MFEEGAMGGAFFETFVVSETIKSYFNAGIDVASHLYYYRDIDIDFLYVDEDAIYPIEVKKSEAPNKPTKNFSVLSKYHMEIKPGLVDCCDKIRPINEKA